MSNIDIRVAHPYFQLKRGTLTLFIESLSTEPILGLKQKLLISLRAHEGSDYSALTLDRLRLVIDDQAQRQVSEEGTQQYQTLDDGVSIGAAGLSDEQIVYFIIQQEDGTWEEPYAADYEADAQDMDMMY
ncbi:hypothetical protein H4S06_002977 [Coemansia sp. BCRC 34490]|nr:hypothetical protein H4S06_002977 [Coemansia sp. BCRC 34490]